MHLEGNNDQFYFQSEQEPNQIMTPKVTPHRLK